MTTYNNIRKTFLDFFEKNNHTVVPSSSLIPTNDPTLMFTAAGMVQFKDVFTGVDKRKYTRATTAQKCLRAGGKHNDLENVGYTARHHTFFEMLGNFSFGDYFKEDAISMAYELITKEYELDPNRLWITVYHNDDEAFNIWKKVTGFADEKIIRISTNDNFWSAGDTGPCGPCSEIFFDYGDHIWGGLPGSAEQDGDRFVEIWNLVFMQFDQQSDGTRLKLPKPSIDTGMGLERIASVLQGKNSNYDTDLFVEIKKLSKELTQNDKEEFEPSHNVIADHLRACSMMIAEGILPSNEGRGYVLRRIMRRAIRHAQKLGAKEPLLVKMAPHFINLMGDTYKELVTSKDLIQKTFQLEEERFLQTLDRGMKLLNEEVSNLSATDKLPGNLAFKLYDTYGFPLDLTQDVLKDSNRSVDVDAFSTCMTEQKDRARKAWSGSGEKAQDSFILQLNQSIPSTEFMGYAHLKSEALVLAIIKDGACVNTVSTGEEVQLILNQTPFYAESGGQVGDKGLIEAQGLSVHIFDVKKVGSLFLHTGKIETGSLSVQQSVKCSVNVQERSQIAANHSATHILHAALRNILGHHVMQKGSLVESSRLRFDFTHTQPLSEIEIQNVEKLVNDIILQNITCSTEISTPDQAIESGAMALFGEKYGDEVRVVSFGDQSQLFSIELCGGTHVQSSGQIGLFKIVSEVGIASGIRRIEAITGLSILNRYEQREEEIVQLKQKIKEQNILHQKQLDDLKVKVLLNKYNVEIESIKKNTSPTLMVIDEKEIEAKDLRTVVEIYQKKASFGIFVALSEKEGKVSICVGLGEQALLSYNANDLVKKLVEYFGGKGGGGKPNLAQGGGDQIQKLPTVHDFIRSLI
ncbi:MAG: alanine--tRNA ligase [Candidatus Puniceispirillum sp.]|nr:alanine--tRNA ligase [Candidatus Pelagibacter sp.]MBA4283606.1 alanine--tRNA ligase [Candidatus Puniceispirillum sp.]